ncbi:alpha/beta fold hydrolase [Rhodococcus ruber]|nr:alpha/beta fold hydrolase [Rhodococcus ruber]
MNDPEIGVTINVGGVATNVHDIARSDADAETVVLLHGSGPGANAWGTWRSTIPTLTRTMRVVAPDLLGFGYTERPADMHAPATSVKHIVDLLDALELSRVSVVGNSYGGGVALRLAVQHPERIHRLVLMGSAGVQFTVTPGLAKVWGYRPSIAAMRELVDILAYDSSLVTDELLELRYQASLRAGVQEAYEQMFAEPFQSIVDDLAVDEELISALPHQTLLIHGREDTVVPPSTSTRLFELIPNSELHIFGKCGHWTQFEHTEAFNTLLSTFLARDTNVPD